jgi:hypothetical protein
MNNFDILCEKILTDIGGSNKAVFNFGRMNPPTRGHELLINKVQEIAKKEGRQAFIFVSKSQDAKKNPLPYQRKLHYLNLFFPNVNFVDVDMANNLFNAAYYLRDKGYDDVVAVGGSDRTGSFEQLRKYLNHPDKTKSLNYKHFRAETVGDNRDPDSDDVTGVSASKARLLARNNDFNNFIKVIPSTADKNTAKQLFDELKHAMGSEEDNEIIKQYFKDPHRQGSGNDLYANPPYQADGGLTVGRDRL